MKALNYCLAIQGGAGQVPPGNSDVSWQARGENVFLL